MSSEDAEWEQAWAEFDRRAGQAPAAAVASHPVLARPRAAMALLLAVPALGLGCGLAAMMLARAPVLPMPLPVLPASLAPQEADMPPLAESLARIAAESTIAACWAARLQPGGSSCAVGAAAR